jgi:subtilisin family serine protease
MKVTVKEFIHVRIGKPSVNAPTFQHLAPGTELEVDGKLYKGDRFEGIDTWVKDAASNFYWSGGIRNIAALGPQEVKTIATVKFNYNQLILIPDHYKRTKGESIVVAIVDTGCFRHKALSKSIVTSFDVFTKQENTSDESTEGHGTFLAGMIAAREDINNEIHGIAPLAQLTIVRAVKNQSVFGKDVLDGLTWLSKNGKPDIINLSVDFIPMDNLKKDFDDVFKTFKDQGTIVVGAGQNGTMIYTEDIFFPATHATALGVGCVSKTDVKNQPVNAQIDFIVPNINFLSTENFTNGYRNLHGCSMSAAFVTGALALIRSWQKKNNNTDSAVDILKGIAESLSPDNFNEIFKIYKR